MGKADLESMDCSVARSIGLVGDPWTLMVLREMFLGSRRFDQLQSLTGMSPHILSERLKTMVGAGLLRKRRYSAHRERFEYRLTEKGRDLWPVIIAFKTWGDKWLDSDRPERQIALTHAICGQPTVPVLTCSACGDPITAVASIATLSPEMQAERERAGQKTQGSHSHENTNY